MKENFLFFYRVYFGTFLNRTITLVLLVVYNSFINTAMVRNTIPIYYFILFGVIFTFFFYSLYLRDFYGERELLFQEIEYKQRYYEVLIRQKWLNRFPDGTAVRLFNQIRDIAQIHKYLSAIISDLILVTVASFTLIYTIGIELLLIFLLVGLIAYGIQRFSNRISQRTQALWDIEEKALSFYESSIKGWELISVFGMQNSLYAHYKAYTIDMARQEKKRSTLFLIVEGCSLITQFLSLVGIPAYCYLLFTKGILTLSQMSIIVYIYSTLSNYIMDAIQSVKNLKISKVAQQQYKDHEARMDCDIYDVEPELTEFQGLCLKNLSYAYESDNLVLKDVNLFFPKCGFIAICGPSGSGKSTLIKLLGGFLTTQKENILWNGKHPITSNELQQQIAFVYQDSFLFPVSVEENIRYGGLEEIKNLNTFIAEFGFEDFIASLPEGGDTVVFPDLSNLSGGQKQLITILRALAKKAPIVLLDEPFSAQDVETEKQIMNLLKKVSEKCLVIIITHRTEYLNSVDIVYHMDNGNITN